MIRRLQKSVKVREVREVMEIEYDFVKEILAYENRVKMNEEMLAVAQKKQAEVQQKQVKAQQKQAEAQQKQEAANIIMLQNGLEKNSNCKATRVTSRIYRVFDQKIIIFIASPKSILRSLGYFSQKLFYMK